MKKRRIFVSFDIIHEPGFKDLILKQSRRVDSTFEVIGYSERNPLSQEEWETAMEKKLGYLDAFLILVGKDTYRAPNVLEELDIANKIKLPVLQFTGPLIAKYRPVGNAGRLYPWSWEMLKKYIH